MNESYTNIPLPQDTKLYSVENQYSNISVEQISSSCGVTTTAGSGYSLFNNLSYYFKLYNQNTEELLVQVNDKSVSSLSGTNSYYNLNGFDYDFDHRFINLDSPTICFLPLIKSKDNGANIDIISGYISTTSLEYQEVELYDYILLTSQTTTSENKIYRIISKTGNTIQIYNDSTINSVLAQDQNVIFTRVLIQNSNGSYYYGLYNTTQYQWASQTKGVKLQDAHYGLTMSAELTDNKVAFSLFSSVNITPKVNEVLAINISSGGKTSGVYKIYRIVNGFVYFTSIYPKYIFIHQFVKINYDFNTHEKSIWIIDPSYIGATTYNYTTRSFAFKVYSANTLFSSPSSWAIQVGGANDTIVGFTLYTSEINNNYIKYSDKFKFTTKVPTWAYNGATVKGLELYVSYITNTLDVEQEEVEI